MVRSPQAMDSPAHATRGGFAALLLAIAAIWLAAMAWATWQANETARLVPSFGGLALLLAFAAWAAWSPSVAREDWGRLALWFAFGATISSWLIGIFSFGWLFFPAVVILPFALMAWPRPPGASVATREGILAECCGFLAGPVVIVLAISLIGR